MTHRTHSLALVLASLVPALTVVWTVDPLTPALVGSGVFLATMRSLSRPRIRWARIGALIGIAIVTSLASLFYARSSGQIFVEWGFITVSEGSFHVALAAFSRVVAIGLPALTVFSEVEAHELIATPVVKRAVPQRAALASLIALRLAPVIAGDLTETRIARRAAGRSTGLGSLVLTTLVIAIRRALRMSEVAEVRGFSAPSRVWTAYRPFTRRDWMLVAVSVSIGILSLGVTALVGEWNGAL